MEDLYTRTRMLIGDGVEKLKSSKVLVCGLGGVGGYVVEALARAGIGRIDVLDNDEFASSNLNRQILATADTVGRRKTDVAMERIKSINPDCEVKIFDMFYTPQDADDVDMSVYDYIADAIDTVTSKIELISRAKHSGVKIISCMGTGNKLGTDFKVADISKTKVCPLAKVMRRELKARGISGVKAVYSEEEPITLQTVPTENTPIRENVPAEESVPNTTGRHIPASISYAPAVAGLVMASEIIGDIIKTK